MNINFSSRPLIVASYAPAVQTASTDSSPLAVGEHPAARARQTFIRRAHAEFLNGSLSAKGRELADATVSASASGVQVMTFAVHGAQSQDIVLTKRVPVTAEGPNFVLYVPQEGRSSFHEFKTREEMTDWIKEQANDPAKLNAFSAHFALDAAPGQVERVKKKLVQFANDDTQIMVGGYGYDRTDVFRRLNQDTSQPPKHVNGLVDSALYNLDPSGIATYKGFRPDGKEVLYQYDQYGNLLGGNRFNYYFVRNSLNNDDPLVPMSFKAWTAKVSGAGMDNVGANDLAGLYHEFIRQLRNPGEGLATALKVFGLDSDVALTVENIMKNPIKGTLLELNRSNHFGRYYGFDKQTMDAKLKYIGDELQGHTPVYGTVRGLSSALADLLEKHGPAAPSTHSVSSH